MDYTGANNFEHNIADIFRKISKEALSLKILNIRASAK